MIYRKTLTLLGLGLVASLSFGCAIGSSPKSAYERAYFAAQAQHDLEVTAKETNAVLNVYESMHAKMEYEALEEEFATASFVISEASLSVEERARLITRLYRQYGHQKGRLDLELLEDKAKGDLLVNNILQGGENIKTLQLAEDLESKNEIEYSEFIGDIIVKSGQQLVFEAENIAAQKAADAALARRLELLAPPEEEIIEEPVPGEGMIPTPPEG